MKSLSFAPSFILSLRLIDIERDAKGEPVPRLTPLSNEDKILRTRVDRNEYSFEGSKISVYPAKDRLRQAAGVRGS